MSVDPARQFYSPYCATGNNPVNHIDPDGERYIPINEVLRAYGAKNREDYLFPDGNAFERFSRIVQYLLIEEWWEVPIQGYKDARDLANHLHKQLRDAKLPHLIKYQKVLLKVKDNVLTEIHDYEVKIGELRQSNGTGFHIEEIKALNTWRIELTDRLWQVGVELNEVQGVIDDRRSEPSEAEILSDEY